MPTQHLYHQFVSIATSTQNELYNSRSYARGRDEQRNYLIVLAQVGTPNEKHEILCSFLLPVASNCNMSNEERFSNEVQ